MHVVILPIVQDFTFILLNLISMIADHFYSLFRSDKIIGLPDRVSTVPLLGGRLVVFYLVGLVPFEAVLILL